MGSTLTRGFKTVYASLFFAIFGFIILNIDTAQLFDPTKILLVIDYLFAVLEFVLSFLGWWAVTIAGTLAVVLGAGFTIPFINFHISIPFLGDPASITASMNALTQGGYIDNLTQSIFPQSSLLSSITAVDPITDFLNVWGVTIAFVLFPVILLSAIGFIIRGESRLAITSFTALQLLIILAMYIPNATSSTGRMLLIDLSLPAFGGTLNTLSSDFLLFLSSQIFLLGLSIYLLLEIAFQAAYVISVVDPMVDRERRIREHLQRIDDFQPQPEKEKATVTLGKGTSKKYDILAASYLREMIERKIYKRGEQELDQKASMRLQSYIASLKRTDSQFETKITAISAQPRTSAILRNLIPIIIVRVFFVIVLAFIILNPGFIIDIVFIDPLGERSGGFLNFPQLIESIELNQPEFRTVILFNIILLILVIAAILHFLLVHRPEVTEKRVQKVDTLVDFKDIAEVQEIEEELTDDDVPT